MRRRDRVGRIGPPRWRRVRAVGSWTARQLARPGLPWLVWFSALVVLAVGWFVTEPGPVLFSCVLLVLACVVAILRNPRVAFLATALLLSFTLFLLVRPLLSVLVGYPPDSPDAYGMPFNRPDVYTHVFGCLALSLAGLFVGFAVLERLDGGGRRSVRPTYASDVLLPALRVTSFALFVLAWPAQVALDVEAAVYVSGHSYFDLYTVFQSQLPGSVRLLGGMLTVAFLAHLATDPGRRRVWWLTGFYLGAALVSVAAGQRTQFILSVVVVAVYVAYRNASDTPPGRWIGRRLRWATALALPVLLVAMGLIGRWRTLPARRAEGALAPLWETLYSQGVSTEVIGYGYVYRAQVPDGHVWSLGHLIDLVTRRLPALLGLGDGVLSGQTVDRAEHSGLFAQLLSYRVLGAEYLKGRGMGSSYVAELWADGSYLLVFAGSLLIGVLVYVLTAALNRSWAVRLVALMLIRELVLIPRSGFSQFVVEAFTAPAILGLLLITGSGLLVSRWVRDRAPSSAPPAARARRAPTPHAAPRNGVAR